VSNPIIIKNRLQVIRKYLKVPGNEPLSEQTTRSLSISMIGTNSYIDVYKALELIPGSRLILVHNGGPTAGSYGQDMFFELPEGPPPNGNQCPACATEDWYKILRDVARSRAASSEVSCNACERYGCADVNEFDKCLEYQPCQSCR